MTERNSIFDLEEFKPYHARFSKRAARFAAMKAYYSGAVYGSLRKDLRLVMPRFYQGVKPLYLPLARAVDVDAGIIPGGWPLGPDATEAQQAAMETVFDWSDWPVYGVLFVHYGAQYGHTCLKVADLREARRVIISPVDPGCVLLANGQTIYVEMREDEAGEYEYAEVTTPEIIRTFRNGEPFGFEGREPEYTNDLAFVPYVESRHIETGEPFGEPTFEKCIPMLDEVNQLASYLGDIIGKHAEPQWAVIGAEAAELVKSGDQVWFLPAGGDAKPLVAPVDITGMLSFVQEIAKNVKDSLPELAFDELRSKTQIATATLELQLMELVLKVKRVRPNYDAALATALRMAGRAAAGMGIAEVGVLDDPGLRFDPERAVLPLDPQTAIDLELAKINLERERGMNIQEGARNESV